MSTKVEHGTVGECAQQLLDALNSRSHERVQRALDGIADLGGACSDSHELEFRDLLAGIVEPISAAVPEFLSAPNAPSKQAVMRMLVHVAGGVSN